MYIYLYIYIYIYIYKYIYIYYNMLQTEILLLSDIKYIACMHEYTNT